MDYKKLKWSFFQMFFVILHALDYSYRTKDDSTFPFDLLRVRYIYLIMDFL